MLDVTISPCYINDVIVSHHAMNPETEHPGPYAVYSAVEHEDEEELRRLLQAGAPRNTYVDGDTALMLAIKRRNVSFVKLFVQYGTDCAPRNRYGATALHLAVTSDIPEMLSIFTTYCDCVDIDQRDDLERTALHYTVNLSHDLNNREILMQLLIDRGADMNAKGIGWETPLHCTVRADYGAAMQLLIDRGADINARNRKGETPLQYAAMYNKFECLRRLVLAGASMSVRVHTMSPLHWAVLNRNQVLVRFLILHGCDTDLLNNNGLTALQLCNGISLVTATTLREAIREAYRNRWEAVVMGHHPRLGELSPMRLMPPDLLREMFEKGH